MKQIHIPVLLEEVLNYLDPKEGEDYLDLTAGYGGHAEKILDRTSKTGRAVLVDRDKEAADHLKHRFSNDERVQVVHDDFRSASERLLDQGRQFDLIFADLGLSSPHLDKASRGFSFNNEGPLDMRMDERTSQTAGEIVNTWSEEALAKLFISFGEVRGAYRIARAIAESRPHQTTAGLASIIDKSTTSHKKAQAKAQVFQALRIAVNDELNLLEGSLPLWHKLLRSGGRIGVISFHSLDDRMVKQYMKEHSAGRYDAELILLTKQPKTSTHEEIVLNPRARSAKLRSAQRK